MIDARQQDLTDWTYTALQRLSVGEQHKVALETVSGDASFRRYFRARANGRSYIAVDAPPSNEDSGIFVAISKLFREAGVATPTVYEADVDKGFMLLEDFGDDLYLPTLLQLQNQNSIDRVDGLYQSAIGSLIKIQKNVDSETLDPYNGKKLIAEMALFEHWFCEEFLAIQFTDREREMLSVLFSFLEEAALSQTQVAVHRDYHSRNLLILSPGRFGEGAGPGIIDFQDAVSGAYTYDLVSLLRDCYVRWTPDQVEKWSLDYLRRAREEGVIADISATEFSRDFDLMGLQRNLKVMGIFARLCIRDNKSQYLADIPLVIQYFLEVGQRYKELAPFLNWFENTVMPVAKQKLNLEP